MYDEWLENVGECQTSFYLGCRNCKSCIVEAYNEEVREELKRKNERTQRFLEKMYGDIEFGNDDLWIQKELDELQATQHEINRLKETLEELKEMDIIETAMSIVNKQIMDKMIEIDRKNKDDRILIDTYKSLYKIDLELMTQEEIDSIDLTVYTDCQPW